MEVKNISRNPRRLNLGKGVSIIVQPNEKVDVTNPPEESNVWERTKPIKRVKKIMEDEL